MDEQKSVVIFDSDVAVRFSFARLFEAAGYKAYAPEDKDEALDYLRAAPVGALLIDLDHPSQDGWDVLDGTLELPNVPAIILFSSFSGDVESASRLGADLLVPKPVDVRGLLQTVEKLLVKGGRGGKCAEGADGGRLPDGESLGQLRRRLTLPCQGHLHPQD